MSGFKSPQEAPAASCTLHDPRREVLDNGIVVLWHESRDSRTVALRGSLPAGSFRETEEQAGLAAFTARLLRRGTRKHSAQELAAVVEDLGASFAVWAGAEETGFSAKCLDSDVEAVLGVVCELLETPAFADEEIGKVRGEIRTELEEIEDSPRARASRSLSAVLYPAGHPYARAPIGRPESIEALGREDFRAFHERCYGTGGLKISLAGPLDVDRVRRSLAGWLPGRAAGPPPMSPEDLIRLRVRPSAAADRDRISLPHKSQVVVLLAGPGIPRDHPDYFSLSMVNLILGSLGLMGRLGERVRDRQGMAYSVSCSAHSRLWAGEWVAAVGVSPGNQDHAVELILEEVQRVRDDLVTEEEHADAVSNLIGSLPLRMETADGIASYLLSAEYYDLGLDFLDRYPGLVRAVTREAMREAARTHMDPAGFSCVMAGPV